MKRFLTLFFIIIYLSSCIEEYDYFTPYINNTINYLDQFRTKTLNVSFSNNQKFEYFSKSGFQLMIPANSFGSKFKKVIISLDYNTTLLDIISNRVQTQSENGKILSFDKIININFRDNNNNKINIDSDKEILIKVPYIKNIVPSLFNYRENIWVKTIPETTSISKSTWYTNDIDSTLVKGYIIKLKNAGKVALASNILNEDGINNLEVKLSSGFDVNNSLVLLTFKKTNVSIPLVWNSEIKAFTLPEGTVLPSKEIVIIVFSEDSNKKTYFGMNYAKVKNGERIQIDIEQKNIEEIKYLINSISM